MNEDRDRLPIEADVQSSTGAQDSEDPPAPILREALRAANRQATPDTQIKQRAYVDALRRAGSGGDEANPAAR